MACGETPAAWQERQNHAAELIERSHQRRPAVAPAAKPTFCHANFWLATVVIQSAPDQIVDGFAVDRLLLGLIDERNHERKAIEFHHI